MKNLLLTLVFLLVCTTLVFSQETSKIDTLTSGKWQIQTVEIENEVMNVANEESWMVFHSDGLYEIYLDKEAQTGTWKIDEQNNLKFDFESFDGKSNITKLTNNQLKFSISGYTLALNRS